MKTPEEALEWCIRKTEQHARDRRRSGTLGQERALLALLQSFKSKLHELHEEQRKERR